MSLTFRNKLDRFPTCWKWGRAFYLLKQQHKNNSSYSSFSDSFLFINKDLCENDLFDWNHQIFQRINRQIIRVTQTPLKSLCLLSRKKKNPCIFRVIFYLKNLSSNGKISNSCSPCSSLTRNKGLCEALGQWSASWLAGWPALSPSHLQSPLDPTQPFVTYWPAWLLFLHVWSFPWKLWFI